LQEQVPPLAVFFFLLVVVAILPTAFSLGALTALLVFVLLWLFTQKMKKESRIVVMDPKSVPQPRTLE
jgi:hypothetical protein